MFRPKKENVFQDAKSVMIANSQTLSIGETITSTAGALPLAITAGGTTGMILGVVVGFKDKAGHSLELSEIVAENDNQTDKQIKAIYLPSWLPIEWESDLDAAAGTTSNSGGMGAFAVDSTGLLVDESTVAAATVEEDKQIFSLGLTGKDTTQVDCLIVSTPFGANLA